MNNRNLYVITGASSGIGYYTSLKIADNINNLVIACSRTIEERSDNLFKEKRNIICKNLDVSNKNMVRDFFENANKFGKLSAIINCAGHVDPKSLFETTLVNWQKTIDINLTGTFLVTKYASLYMRENGGKIINIASTAGMSARPGWCAYAASKSAVINFSETMAEELKNYGIRVYVISPGRTATPLRKILAPNEDPTSIMQPTAVANVILRLLSSDMDVLEGQPIIVRDRY